MKIRTYQPGDEAQQVAIYNAAAASFPKFKPATLDEVRRRCLSSDFDRTQLLIAEEDNKPVGSIQEVTLARILHDNSDPNQVTIREIMAKPLPQLDVTVHLDEAYRLLLAGNTGVLAVNNGKVVDIVTRIDLIEYWTKVRRSS